MAIFWGNSQNPDHPLLSESSFQRSALKVALTFIADFDIYRFDACAILIDRIARMSNRFRDHFQLLNSMPDQTTEGIRDPQLTKREFLRFCGTSLSLLSAAYLFGRPEPSRAQEPQKGLIKTKLSPYYTPLRGDEIQCDLCPRRCRLRKGERGFCRVRENRNGKCYSLVYGNPCVVHLDPIEKKPFFHVLPATMSLSLATAGCNFDCKFCQNWEISQAFPEDVYSYDVPPETVVEKAKAMRAYSIAHTYVEPVIFHEYMLDVGSSARKARILNVIHSNGFINPAPLRDLCKVLDAANIDLKGFTDAFYQELCSGELDPVLETLKTLKQMKIHVEITNLVIPLKNDEISMIREMCLWVRRELGPETPVHFSRFYPLHKLKNLPPTPVSTLEKARTVALSSGLEFVYIGNVPGHEGENTFCPKCKKMLIQRAGYMVGEVHLKDGKCAYCGKPIPGIWTSAQELQNRSETTSVSFNQTPEGPTLTDGHDRNP